MCHCKEHKLLSAVSRNRSVHNCKNIR